jgi:hypothetical protein
MPVIIRTLLAVLLLCTGSAHANLPVKSDVVFTTLFLSLTTGAHPVAFAVEGPVSAVELHLDGQLVAVVSGEPWQCVCDFGQDLLPHLLVARALDGNGKVVAQTRQLVNVPRPDAETTILLQHDESGLPATARVVWQGVFLDEVKEARITLDGQQIPCPDLTRIELPAYEPQEIHLLSDELRLSESFVTRAQVTFGGLFGSNAQTELTAALVLLDDAETRLDVAGMDGWFTVGGKPAQVVAVERSRANLMIVQDETAADRLVRAGGLIGVSLLQRAKDEEEQDRIRIVHPEAWSHDGASGQTHLFPILYSYRMGLQSLRWYLCEHTRRPAYRKQQRLSDALAVAGVRAAAEGSRRAVLLIVDKNPDDFSEHSAGSACGYLRSLQVPLFVWSSAKKELVTPWGDAELVNCYRRYEGVANRLFDHLSRQRVVWLNGSHLPNQLELTGKATGVQLVN